MIETPEQYAERCLKAAEELSAAISEIDYMLGEPNEMHVSAYDLHCDPWAVVEGVRKRLNVS